MAIDYKKVHIFIDGPNLHQAVKRCCGNYRLNIEKLAQKLATPGREIVGISYYDAPYLREISVTECESQQRFFDYLRKNSNICVCLGYHAIHPYRLNAILWAKIKQYVRAEDLRGPVEKSVDVQLAVDMVRLAYDGKYGTGIIVSGDGDFVKAVEAVRARNIRVQNANFFNSDRKGSAIRSACNSFIPLTQKSLSDCLLSFSQSKPASDTPKM